MVSNINQKTSLDAPERPIILASEDRKSVRFFTNTTVGLGVGAMLLLSNGPQTTPDTFVNHAGNVTKQCTASTDSLDSVIQKIVYDSISTNISIAEISMMLFPSPVELTKEEAAKHKKAIESFFT